MSASPSIEVPVGPQVPTAFGPIRDVLLFLLTTPREVTWLVRALIPVAAVVILGGESSVFKSWIALYLAGSVASGTDLLPGTPCRTGPVWFFDFENGRDRLHRRTHLLWPNGLEVAPGMLSFFIFPSIGIGDQQFFEALEELVAAKGPPALIVIDTLRAATAGADENDSNARAPIDLCKKFADKYGTAFVLVHHTRKGGGRGLEALRGSSAIGNAVDVYLAVERTDAPKTARVRLVKDRDGGADVPLVFRLALGSQQPVAWDWEALGSASNPDPEQELDKQLLAVIEGEPGLNQEQLAKRVSKRNQPVGEAMRRLREAGRVVGGGRKGFQVVPEGGEP